MIIMQANESQNREERLLPHVSMVAKFLEDNKPKKTLKKAIHTISRFTNLIQFQSLENESDNFFNFFFSSLVPCHSGATTAKKCTK